MPSPFDNIIADRVKNLRETVALARELVALKKEFEAGNAIELGDFPEEAWGIAWDTCCDEMRVASDGYRCAVYLPEDLPDEA